MKFKFTLFLFLISFCFLNFNQKGNAKMDCPEILNYEIENIAGKKVSLCEYKGKTILAVNTASKCGFTRQYKGLEELYQKYKDKGFVVLGFPSNDFGGQEPGTNDDVKNFCERNYGVSFPLFAKSSVKKEKNNPFFKKLTEAAEKEPKWNFNKYLISPDGQTVTHFGSMTSPTSKKITRAIEELL